MVADQFITSYPTLFFGAGTLQSLAYQIIIYGNNVLIITGNKSFPNSLKSDVLSYIDNCDIKSSFETVLSEPDPELVDRIVNKYRNKKIDVIISIGGGSVIDAGKAISAMLTVEDSIINYLEGVGTKTHPGSKIPFFAIPTTSGTGSETTKNAVISKVGINGFKKSLRHDNFTPTVTLVDPVLTLSCPVEITAASGMDAFTQLLESYVSTKATAFTDKLAITGLKKISQSLTEVVKNGNNIEARTNMSYAAMLSGITLTNAGLGVVHGFASSIGGLFNVPHGIVCGTLMADCNKITIENLLKHDPENIAIEKYLYVADIFLNNVETKTKEQKLNEFINRLFEYTSELNLPRLSKFGIKESDFDRIIELTSNKNNPYTLNKNDLFEILKNRL
ncbi:iron-containing alcohol dehydrogenase [Bacteroidota bacterium]